MNERDSNRSVNRTVSRIAYDAVLAAMCAVLGYISIDAGVTKLTFENLPVIIGAMMFGPIDGMLIGGIGTFIYQLVRYGIDATTLLWIIPYVVSGAFVGFFSKFYDISASGGKTYVKNALLLAANGLIVTALNTLSLYITYQYIWMMPTETIFATLWIKILVGILKAAVYAVLVPMLIRALKKAGLYRRPGKNGTKITEREKS